MKRNIICVHIGARSHYLLPKALEHSGHLDVLITDTWISSSLARSVLAKLPLRLMKSFSKRYSPLIPSNRVISFGVRFIFAEIFIRSRYKTVWQQILARNDAFQHIAISIFKKQSPSSLVFGISYTSLQVFKEAKKRGQKTILFQIDAGLQDERIVSATVETNQQKYPSLWQAAPASYWDNWKEECALSDVIMVNSEWSKTGLMEEGISGNKIKVVPLPFELKEKHFQFRRTYVQAFTKEIPLRCLFLGNISLRKGVHLILEAAQSMTIHPIEFIFVGESEIDFSSLSIPNVRYEGVITRSETDKYYQQAHVFLFPTLSDGFGLTQLEAMSWKLPVIASKYCGEVITGEVNGFVLQQNTAKEISSVLLRCLYEPGLLQQLSQHCFETAKQFTINNFAEQLTQCFY